MKNTIITILTITVIVLGYNLIEYKTENEKLENKINQLLPRVQTTTTRSLETISETVYVTRTGSKYHRENCSYLKSKIEMDKTEAIERGYTPCSRCNP